MAFEIILWLAVFALVMWAMMRILPKQERQSGGESQRRRKDARGDTRPAPRQKRDRRRTV